MGRPKAAPFTLTDEERQTVIENRGLAYDEAYKYWCGHKAICERDDIDQWAFIGLMKAVHYHKPERGKLSTFAVTVIRNEISKGVRTFNKVTRDPKMLEKGITTLGFSLLNNSPCIALESEKIELALPRIFQSKDDTEKEAFEKLFVRKAFSVLTEKEKAVFKCLYLKEMKKKDILRELRIGKRTLIKLEEGGLNKMAQALGVEVSKN